MLHFDEDKSQERYNIDFSLRKISNGRWVDYNFFDFHNFELSMKLKNLGWKYITILRDVIYLDLVAHFYANATREYGQVFIDSYVKGVLFTLDRSVIRKILRIGLSGEIYKDKYNSKRTIEGSLWTIHG